AARSIRMAVGQLALTQCERLPEQAFGLVELEALPENLTTSGECNRQLEIVHSRFQQVVSASEQGVRTDEVAHAVGELGKRVQHRRFQNRVALERFEVRKADRQNLAAC